MPSDMQRVVLELPPETPYKESKLFEYVSFKKAPKVKEHHRKRIGKTFEANLRQGNKTFTPPPKSFNKKNVVIKNIGNATKAHLKNALEYAISHSDDNLALDSNGEYVSLDDIMKDWQDDFSKNPKTNEGMHLVFSLNEPHSESLMDILKESARQTMQSHFPEYKWVMAAHTHQNKPHIHIIVNKTNIFSGKKLHFKSKAQISQFFDELREDFKANLFEYSRGKLDYVNEVRFDKRFRQEMIDNKIADLEASQIIKEPKQELDFMKTYKKTMSDFSNRRKGYLQKVVAVEKSLKNNSIHLKNVSKKIDDLQEKGINPTNLIQKQLLLAAQVESERKEKERLKKDLANLDKGLEHFVNFEANFKAFTKNFEESGKQKAFIKSFSGYERFLPVDLNQKLRDMSKAIEKSENSLKNDFEKVNEGVIKGVSDFNEKSNVFKLQKAYSKLVFYKGIVSSLDFSENASLRDKKQGSIDTLRGLEKDIIKLMQEHLKNIPSDVKQTLKAIDELKQDYTLDNMSLARAALRLDKKLKFYETSLKAIVRFDKKYELGLISKGIEQRVEQSLAQISGGVIGVGNSQSNEIALPVQNQAHAKEVKQEVVKTSQVAPSNPQTAEQKTQSLPKNANAPLVRR